MSFTLPTVQTNVREKVSKADKASVQEYEARGYQGEESGDFVIFKKRIEDWEKFEIRLAKLLEKMGVENVLQGARSRIAGYQVDVQGGYKSHYLVVSCKHSAKGSYTVREAIRELYSRSKKIEKEVIGRSGSQYTDVHFVLALSGIEFTSDNLEYAREHGITIWGNHFLSSAEKLYKAVGPRAINHLLKPIVADIGTIPGTEYMRPRAHQFVVPAFRVSVEGTTVYHFQMPAEILLDLAYVSRLTPGNEGAYQRMMVQTKLDRIAEFIEGDAEEDRPGGIFKNNLIATFDAPVSFIANTSVDAYLGGAYEFGTLRIPASYGTLWIIDGQHRLYGYGAVSEGKRQTPLPVAAYEDSDGSLQAEDFITINQNQKKIDNNLLWELLERIRPEESREWAISKLGQELGRSGYFAKRIYMPGFAQKEKAAYSLTLGTICRAIKERKILEFVKLANNRRYPDPEAFPETAIQEAKKVIEEFYFLVEESLPKSPKWKEDFLRKGNGFSVMFNILEEYLKLGEGWSKASAAELMVSPIKQFFSSKKGEFDRIKGLSGYGPYRKFALEIMREINKRDSRFAYAVLSDSGPSDPVRKVSEIENALRLLIFKTLSGPSPRDWWSRFVPVSVQKTMEQRYARNYGSYDGKSADIMKVMGFPEYKEIIFGDQVNNWPKFARFFEKSKSWVKVQLDELRDIRNMGPAHSNEISSTQEEKLNLIYKELMPQLIKSEDK